MFVCVCVCVCAYVHVHACMLCVGVCVFVGMSILGSTPTWVVALSKWLGNNQNVHGIGYCVKYTKIC